MLPAAFTPSFLRQLELFSLRSRRAFLGTRQGGHLSPKRGHGIEFSDYRKYELGDNPRWIDWGVYARTERLYVRRYQEEQNLSVLILLDTSASMRNPAQDNKWPRACELALALTYVALMNQDTVVLAPLGETSPRTFHGARAIHHASAYLTELLPTPATMSLTTDIMRAAARVRFPGICVAISDFLLPLPEVRSSFTALLSKNLDVAALQVLGPSDVHPFADAQKYLAVDSETGDELELSDGEDAAGRYAHLFATHQRELSSFCTSRGIRFSSVQSEEPLSASTLRILSRSGLLA